MSCKKTENKRYTWCPKDLKGMEHLTLSRWLRKTMGEEAGNWWLHKIDRLAERSEMLGVDGMRDLIQQVCRYDCPELVELLYPRWPERFQEVDKEGHSALELCAHYGSAASLWTLLELGAEPNGLDRRELHHFLFTDDSGRSTLFWLTPLDRALGMEHEDCSLLLELYGGRTAAELTQTPPGELPDDPLLLSLVYWPTLREPSRIQAC